MKKAIVRFGLAVILVIGLATSAAALPINGAVSFSGTVTFDDNNLNLATKFTSFSAVTVNVGGGTGSYSGLAGGTAVTFPAAGFTFFPALSPNPLIPLWTVTVGPTTYSLDATGLVISFRNAGSIVLEGPGIAHITGFDDTLGTWSITANAAGATATFSGSTVVPEPLTLILFGSGLVGLAGLRRKLR